MRGFGNSGNYSCPIVYFSKPTSGTAYLNARRTAIRVKTEPFSIRLKAMGVSRLARNILIMLSIVIALNTTGCRVHDIASARRVARIASVATRSPVQVRERSKENHRRFGFVPFTSVSPEPSERTQLLLRRYNLVETYESNPREVIHWLRELVQSNPQMNEVHALSLIHI